MVLTTDELHEAAINCDEFTNEEHKIFGQNIPGNLKLVWKEGKDNGWSFVTHNIASYALVSKNTSAGKMPSVSNVSPLEIYKTQCELLEKKFSAIMQNRRSNKLKNLESIIQEIIFKP